VLVAYLFFFFTYRFALAAEQVEGEMCGKKSAESLQNLFPAWKKRKEVQKWCNNLTLPNTGYLIPQEQKGYILRSRGLTTDVFGSSSTSST